MLKKNHCNTSCVMEETWKKKQFDKMCPENNLYNTELVPEAVCEFCIGKCIACRIVSLMERPMRVYELPLNDLYKNLVAFMDVH